VPKAGFWSVGGYDISFRKDGRWYADDELVENPRIALLFSQNVRSDGEGGWVIDLKIDCQPVRVEDTALVIRMLEGDPESGFRIKTNDGVEEPLDCSTLEIGDGNVLYCMVDRGERGRIRTRFLRNAYYALARHFEQDGDSVVLPCAGRRFRVASGDEARVS
jgi:hypothetical protein